MQEEKRNKLENLTFEASYFEDEVREGFYISSMMKRYWAAQLTVLSQVDRVCKKHNIPWYADCGTLLGAVRHGGFIPWDDDLDICMLRHDWIRFFALAKEELPEEYCILSLHTETDYKYMIGRVVNAHAIDMGGQHMREYHGCPYTVGIDIFPLDGLSEDEAAEEERRSNLADISKAVGLFNAGEREAFACKRILAEIERKHHTTLHRRGNLYRELLLLADKLYTMYPSDTAEHIALMPFWVSHHNHKYDKELFAHTIELPFENTYLTVPARYDEVLRIEYGEYMRVKKGGGIHEYPVYGEQEEILRKTIGHNPYRYTMGGSALPDVRKGKPLAIQCREMMEMLIEAQRQIGAFFEGGDYDTVWQLLEGCQNLAVSLGTLLESRVPQAEGVVHRLEDYCERIYEASESLGEERLDALDRALEEVTVLMEEAIRRKKREILFLPVKADWWHTMEPVWRRAAADPANEVYVMPLPYLIEDAFSGEAGVKYDGRALFPPEVPLVTVDEYDISRRHPDEIVIQFPYDEWGDVRRIPEFFYSKNLLPHTEKLTYVPCFATADPQEKGDKASQALRVLIEQPAVRYADRVIVPSETMRQLYWETLTEICGSGWENYWDGKLEVLEAGQEQGENQGQSAGPTRDAGTLHLLGDGKKLLLYQVNAAFFMQYGDQALRRLRDTIATIRESGEGICCVFSPHESVGRIADFDKEYGEQLADVFADIRADEVFFYDEDHQAESCLDRIAGYYGNPGRLAHLCAERGIPVMLMAGDLS